jgi:hypothetical protein
MTAEPSNQGVLDEIVALVTRVAAPDHRPITRATELYYDLGLAGDDLYDVITAIRARFGTDFSTMILREYAPGEVEGLFSFDTLREVLGRPQQYRSLTIELLVEAVRAGGWKVA